MIVFIDAEKGKDSSTVKIQKLKGTRDFYPEDKRVQNYIFDVWRKVALKYGYEEYDGPLLEPATLWTTKSGQEITEQMYAFKDKAGRKIAVRPELTPTLARMVAKKQQALKKPIRWYSTPRCWRYEQPQSGRLREFWQFNLDILGTEDMTADAETIATAVDIMREFGLTKDDFYIRISNRRLIKSLLFNLGVKDENYSKVSTIIDKVEKISREEFLGGLKKLGCTKEQGKKILELIKIVDIKKIKEKELDEKGKKGLEELKDLLKYLKGFGVAEFCKLDLSIMRGFDYYTSTVFEVFDKTKKYRAIAGGGRYDDLVKVFGGQKCPGVGYAMGDVVLELFLKYKNKMPEIKREIDYYIAPVKPEVMKEAIKMAQKLRKKYNVELGIMGQKVGKQLAYAESIGAKKVVIIGPKELKKGKVVVRDTKTKKKETVSMAEVV